MLETGGEKQKYPIYGSVAAEEKWQFPSQERSASLQQGDAPLTGIHFHLFFFFFVQNLTPSIELYTTTDIKRRNKQKRKEKNSLFRHKINNKHLTLN